MLMPVIDEVSKNCGKGQIIDHKNNIIEYVDKTGNMRYCRAKMTWRLNYKDEIEYILWKQGEELKLVAGEETVFK